MKNIARYVLNVIVIIVFPLITCAQTVYEGQVIDKATELPIPYATVKLLKAGIAMQTNEQGYFNITVSAPLPNDKLVFSVIGYKTKELAISAYQAQMFILLEASNTQLKEVTISGRKRKTLTLADFSYKNVAAIKTSLYGSHKRSLFPVIDVFAKLFELPESNALLERIQLVRVTQNALSSKKAGKFTSFKVHVLSVNPGNGAPDSVLFTREVSLNDKSLKINIDMVKEHIILPSTKFFVAIEWIKIPYNEFIITYTLYFDEQGSVETGSTAWNRVIYQPLLLGYEQKKRERSWIKINGVWQEYQHPLYETALSATVTY
jgi:hypothetical protein